MGPAKPFFSAPFTPPPLIQRRQRLPLTGRLPHCITLHASATVQFECTHPEEDRKRGSYHPFKLTRHPSSGPSHPIRVPLSPSQIRPRPHGKGRIQVKSSESEVKIQVPYRPDASPVTLPTHSTALHCTAKLPRAKQRHWTRPARSSKLIAALGPGRRRERDW